MNLFPRLARLRLRTRRSRGPAYAPPDTALERLRRTRSIPLLALLVLVAPLIPRTAFAQTQNDPPAPTATLPTGMSFQTGQGTLGSTESSAAANVDPTTGALRTSITFALPTARGAVQPQLALTYNSSGGFGIGGRGWSLALPSIERHNPSGPPQFQNDPVAAGQLSASGGAVNPAVQDEFTFGGEPLVEICYIGAGGACTYQGRNSDHQMQNQLIAGESLPSFTTSGNPSGWHYYRLQTETGSLQRFFWSPDHKTWVVQDKSGATSEYSASDLDGYGGFFRWNVTRRYDAERFGTSGSAAPPALPVPNLVSYVWTQMTPPNGVPLTYLTDIYDTPRPGVTAPDTSSFAHHTHLVYTLPSWTPSIIAPVWKASPAFVLSRVDVTSQDLNATGARQQVRRYYLTYTSVSNGTSDGPPAVYSVQLEGNCSGAGGWIYGTPNNAEGANGQLLDPSQSTKCPTRPQTTFTYAPIVTDFTEAGFTPQGVAMPSLAGSVSSPTLFDLNNDGLPDVLAAGASPPVAWLNSLSGFSSSSQSLVLGPPGGTPSPLNTIGQLVPGQFLLTGRFQMDGQLDMMWTDVASALKVTPGTYGDTHGNPASIPANDPLYSDTPVNYEWVTVSAPSTTGTQPTWTLTPSATVSTFNLTLKYPAWPPLDPTSPTSPNPLQQGCSGGWAFSPPGWGLLNGPVDETFALGSEGALAPLDIDGDGVTDLLTATSFTQQIETPQSCAEVWAQYGVRFSKRGFDYNYTPFFGAAPSSAPSGARTDVCIGGLPANQQNPTSSSANAFGDVDGDGIVDFIQLPATSDAPMWWPGHGDGVFGLCPNGIPGLGATSGAPLQCDCGSARGVLLPVVIPTPSVGSPVFAVHDVTGDGLGDVIVSGMPYPGEVSVYPNLGRPIRAGLTGFPDLPAFGAPLTVSVNGLLGWSGNASPTSLYFADMNGSGVDDIIVQEVPAGGTKATALGYIDLFTGGPDGTQSLRPGLLTDIDNGLGLKTHATYGTSVQLGSQATPTWTTPQPLHVVTSVTASDSTGDAYTTSYTYSGPVFDDHDNRFLGFQKVKTTSPGAASQLVNTETTYFYAACTAPGAAACAPGRAYPSASYRGLPTLTEVFDGVTIDNKDSTSPTYLSTTHHSYVGQPLYTGNDDRKVTHVYESQTDTFLYDADPFLPGPSNQSIADVDLPSYPPASVSVRGFGGRHLQTTVGLPDPFGNVTSVVDHGDVGDISSTPPDPSIFHTVKWAMPTNVDPTINWIWRQSSVSTSASADDPTGRTTSFTYDAQGNLTEVYRTLTGSLPLPRNTTLGVAGPLDASGSGNAHIAQVSYDPAGTGNPLFVQMYPSSTSTNETPRCTQVSYDDAYGQLSTSEIVHVGDCSVKQAIVTQHVYDRGLGVEIGSTLPAGGQSAMTYDGFGRLATIAKPDPVTGLPGAVSTTISFADTYSYGQLVHVSLAADPAGNYAAYDTYQYEDAFGRPLFNVSTADGTNQWVQSGQVHRDARGRVDKAYVPRFVTGDPTAFYTYATPTLQSTTASYDAFGRVLSTADVDGTVTSQMGYHALSVVSKDAEQWLSTGSHYGAYTQTRRDGHGRTVEVDEHEHIANGLLTTVLSYQATGEVKTLSRSGTNSAGVAVSYARSMQYDTFGRLVKNTEPNVGSWTYAYNDVGDLVGTSDARGCGKNLAYDGAGRLLSEDFSPCQAPPLQQMLYTSPLPNGDGTEAFYVYEGGSLQTGAVSDVYDRASHSRFYHDMRGRLHRVDRQLAGPGTDPTSTFALYVPSALADRYSTAVFSQVTSYDDRDRPSTQTTGAHAIDLLAKDLTSAVTGSYSPRGIVESVTSSYGPLVLSTAVEADGRLDTVKYADPAQTTLSYSYNDARNRLSETKIWRAHSFPLAPDTTSLQPTQQNVLVDDVLPTDGTTHYAAYDAVGNPQTINDIRPLTVNGVTQWPSGTEPVSRTFLYDDSYRLTTANQSFPNGTDTYVPPLAPANAHTSPVPLTTGGNRVTQQKFSYDGLGNMTSSTDLSQTFFDRSLGPITQGTPTNTQAPGPNQLAFASLGTSTSGNTGSVNATYDQAGNTVQLAVERNGPCSSASGCNQLFQYDWDEVGRLTRARRFDFVGGKTCVRSGHLSLCTLNDLPSNYPYPALPSAPPNADVSYAYDAGGQRVLRASAQVGPIDQPPTTYSAEIFPSLRLNHAQWLAGAYDDSSTTEAVYLTLGSAVYGRVVYNPNPRAPNLPSPQEIPFQHVFLELTDSLGSTTTVIDKDTSELVERTTYLAYGAVESDYQPDRWKISDGTELQSFREDYRFTGKEDDVEIGLTYFGARYYSPQLGRWISPDPLAIHGLGADLNPYAYVRGRVTTATDPFGLDDDETNLPPIDVCASPNDACNGWKPPAVTNPTQLSGPQPSGYGDNRAPLTVPLWKFYGSRAMLSGQIDPSAVAGFKAGVDRNSTVLGLTGAVAGAQVAALTIFFGGAGLSALRDGTTALDNILGTAANAANNAVATGLGAVGRVAAGVVGALFGKGSAAGDAPANCFDAGTLVAMCDGSVQPIETLREHDRVLSENDDGAIECREVTQTFERVAADRATLTVGGEGRGAEALHTTLDHRFWVEGRGWVPARSLAPGDVLRSANGRLSSVRAVAEEAERGRVFNIEVERDHTYFVGEAKTLVHNECGPPEVTPEAIRAAMADAQLATKQGAVSIPVIRDYAARAAAGEVAPAIKVADGVIVEGNHRYIAGRLVGIEPAQTEGVLPAFKADKPNVSWSDVFLDPTDWGNR